MWHLQRVLAKKRDPLSHTLFLDVVAPKDEDPLPLDRFWRVGSSGLCAVLGIVLSAQLLWWLSSSSSCTLHWLCCPFVSRQGSNGSC